MASKTDTRTTADDTTSPPAEANSTQAIEQENQQLLQRLDAFDSLLQQLDKRTNDHNRSLEKVVDGLHLVAGG
ncbi:MAG: hypothetical protein AAFP69_18560, partial [Planctomycetota bacterium]